jgi:hypothetical protein
MIEIEYLNAELGSIKKPKHYDQWKKVRETMYVHTRGKNPGNILTGRRPNEDPEVQKYRLSIYEPITKGSINRAIDKLYRIFVSANFSIQVSEELSIYLGEKKFNNQYFYNFIQKYVVRRMIEDPNGWLVWIPYGEGLTNPGVKVEVEPVLISSAQIKYIDEDAITWMDDEEHSEVLEYGKKKVSGEVYYTLTDVGFYKHIQVGNKSDKRFELVPIYIHDMGFLPGTVLGGDLTDEDYFESYFSAFVPFANEAIRQYSDWQGVMTTSAFPYREEQSETCSAPGCRDGFVYDNDLGDSRACRSCKGTGKVISRSPYGVFMRAPSNVIDGQTNSTEPMIRFVSPPVDIINYSGEAWQILLKKAEEALHLNVIDESQSGIAKMIDREDSFSQLTKINNNVFDEIIYNSLRFIEKYRNVSNPMDPMIVKPISFSMKTEEDLISEINSLTDKNAPVAFLVETTKDLAKKRFSGNKVISRIVEVLVTYDPIYHVNTKDKQMLLAAGTIKKEDVVKSLFAYKVLQGIVSQNGTEYLEKPLTEIFADLDNALKPIVDQYTQTALIGLNG